MRKRARQQMMRAEVMARTAGIEPDAGKANVPVGPQQIERAPRNVRTRQFERIVRLVGNDMGVEQMAEFGCGIGHRRLTEQQQIEARVIEPLVQILDLPVRPESEAQPGKAITGARPIDG